MNINDEAKRRAMKTVSHRETLTTIRNLNGGGAPVRRTGTTPLIAMGLGDLKRQAMKSIPHAETLARIGSVKMTAGIGIYAARIREMDRDARIQKKQQQVRQQPWPTSPARGRQNGRNI